MGMSDIEDALARLDQLTQEEVRMAAAQSLKATHAVHDEVKSVEDRLQGVGSDVQQVDIRVQRVDDKIQGVDDKVQQVADDIGDQKSSLSNTHLTGHEGLMLSQGISFERTSETGSLPQTHL
jgi:predicted  nucleic acid-binding Zn-ribbon protein